MTKFLVKEVNLETITDMQSWYKTWLLNGNNRIRVKQKPLRQLKRACTSSWSRLGSQKSFKLTIPRSLAKPVKTFLGIIVRRHLTIQKEMGLLREQYAELKKGPLLHCCNQVWMKNGGRIPWNVTAICEMFLISRRTGRHCTIGDLENLLEDQLFHLVQWLNTTLFPWKTSRESINLVGKYYLVYSWGYALYAGGIWKGDILVVDIEELEKMDASEIYAKDSMQKRW